MSYALVMFVVTMTDGSTFECQSFQPDKGGLRCYAKGEKLKKYVPMHSIRVVDKKQTSGGDGGSGGSGGDGGGQNPDNRTETRDRDQTGS